MKLSPKMTKIVHFTGVLLTLASVLLAELAKNTHFAWAAGALGLVTTLQKAFGSVTTSDDDQSPK